MITIRLLGGAKKAVGRPAVDFDRPSASVAEILQFLTGISSDTRLLQPNNLIVAINGVDSAALQGQQTLAKSGDTVTVVTVVHGGASHALDGNHVSIIGVQKIAEDAGKLVDRLRAQHGGVSIQAVDAGAVYGAGKIVYNLLDGHTVAIDANTGRELWKTQIADLGQGETTPMAPFIAQGRVFVGPSGGEFGIYGWVKALDLETGKILWTAHNMGPDSLMLARPGRFRGGPNLGVSTWSAGPRGKR